MCCTAGIMTRQPCLFTRLAATRRPRQPEQDYAVEAPRVKLNAYLLTSSPAHLDIACLRHQALEMFFGPEWIGNSLTTLGRANGELFET